MGSNRIRALFSKGLRDYLPAGTEHYVANFLAKHHVHFTITPPRKTKFGDYRSPRNGKHHRITVNGNLNRYAFLVTTVHEMAHLLTYERYEKRGIAIQAHGKEWKASFAALFRPLLAKRQLLPDDVREALEESFKDIKASSCTDVELYRVLKSYDQQRGTLVEQLQPGTLFALEGRVLIRGKKLRVRYACKERDTQKVFHVHGMAEIDTLIEDEA